MIMKADFYGTGFAFPPRVDPATGQLERIGDTTIIAQALRVLLRTAPGERLMRPDYGCDLRRFLFAPNTVSTRRLIAAEVSRAIPPWEARVDLTGVDVTASPVEPAELDIVVNYTIRRSGTPATLVEQLRLGEGEG
jgi:phage baseplate assembly protein W